MPELGRIIGEVLASRLTRRETAQVIETARAQHDAAAEPAPDHPGAPEQGCGLHGTSRDPGTSAAPAVAPPLSQRIYGETIASLTGMLRQARPSASYGMTDARHPVLLAEQALAHAAELVADPNMQPIDPAAAGALVAHLGHVTDNIGRLLTAAMRQVGAARHTTTGGYQTPPGSDPLAELDAILRDLNAAAVNIDTATARLDVTGRRLARVVYTGGE